MQTLSVVVPVYNEEAALPTSCACLKTVLEHMVSCGLASSVELILVDDGSRDGSWSKLSFFRQTSSSANMTVRLLRFSRNFGHSAAVFAGLDQATGDLVAIIDADLQDPPEELVKMVQLLREKQVDVVYGQRLSRQGENAFKKITAWAFYRMLNLLSGVAIPKDTGDFRVMTREVAEAVRSLSEGEPFLRGLVAWVGFRQLAHPYVRQARELGETKYPLRKMLKFAFHAILSFSSMPLKLSFYFGSLGVLMSCAVGVYALCMWFTGTTIPGWASVMIGFSFGQSFTLILIGMVGLYLGRVHNATQYRPRYILRKAD